jgi:hypothetical protein
MPSRLALARIKERHAALHDTPDRVPQRIRRQRKEREARFNKEARKARPANGSGSLLGDPDYHMARGVGFDVMRRDLRKPEPPLRPHRKANPHYDPAAVEPVPSAECATWLWWKSLDAGQRHAFYELTHEGEPPAGVVVLNMGLEITNPAILVEVW